MLDMFFLGFVIFVVLSVVIGFLLIKTGKDNWFKLLISSEENKKITFDKVKGLVVLAVLFIIGMFISYKIFTTMIWYNYDNKNKASKGVIFKDTLMLSEHRLIGSSNYVIFEIDNYSRSDRQLEVISVIVNRNKFKEEWKTLLHIYNLINSIWKDVN